MGLHYWVTCWRTLNWIASYTVLALIYKKFKLGLPNWMCLCSSNFFLEQSCCFSQITPLLQSSNTSLALSTSFQYWNPVIVSKYRHASFEHHVFSACSGMHAEDSSCSSAMRLKILQPLRKMWQPLLRSVGSCWFADDLLCVVWMVSGNSRVCILHAWARSSK